MSNPKLNFKEETSAKKTRSPPEKAKVEQTQPKKKKLKLDTDKAKEKAQHLRFGKAELTPDDLRRLSKEQKREMYAAALARSAAHREIDQYEEDNVGVQALSEGEKAAGNVQDFSKNRYSRKLKKKAKMQAKKKNAPQNLPPASQIKHKMQEIPAFFTVKPVRAAPTGFPGGGRNRIFVKVITPLPGRAARWRRPQAAKRLHPAAHLQHGLA
ncbi:MAG: hypothetical protein ACI4JC_07160 [Faecalibacterium sp.]